MPIELSPDRRELMRKLAADGRRILELQAKLRKLPPGSGRDAVLQELAPIETRQRHRQMRLTGRPAQ